MADMGLGRSLLEIEPCRYGYSQLDFRGPEADLDQPYIAFLGTTETVGPFLTRPFPYLVADALGMGCANLGVKNAGPDVFLNDPELLRVAQGAEAVVIEVMTAANLSNAFYKVHPRRNDRVVRSHPALYDLARGLDTTDIHFTGHLLEEVSRVSPNGAQRVIKAVQAAWVERMQALVAAIGRPVHILRFVADGASHAKLVEPLMLAALASMSASVTRVSPSVASLSEGTEDMFFQPGEQRIAAQMLSAAAHHETAEILVDVLSPDMETARAG
ncbi:MAG: DUF6473 family protein [Pseudomonadota bacterium]